MEKKKKIIIAIVIAIIVIAAAYFVVAKVVIPHNTYTKAVALLDSGKYEEAITVLQNLDGYKNSDELKATAELKLLSEAEVDTSPAPAEGLDTVSFGNYKGNTEWIILAKEDGKVLLLSKRAIEQRPYHSETDEVTWETCTLRSWLNNEYLSSAFNSAEQARIITTTTCSKTTDKVFLLSKDEAAQYIESGFLLEAKLSDGKTSVAWWLRSYKHPWFYSWYVYTDGKPWDSGEGVNMVLGVRPAIWVDISNVNP